MAIAYEVDIKNKPRDMEKVLRRLNSDKTPFASMLPAEKQLTSMKSEVTVKKYQRKGHAGVHDATDATDFNTNLGDTLACYAQKEWYNVGVSDLTDATESGTAKVMEELGIQIDEAYVTLKQAIEARALSDGESAVEDKSTTPYRTRGFMKWAQATAQSHDAVPAAYRPAAAQIYAGTLAAFSEDELAAMVKALYKSTRGQAQELDAFLGIELKAKFSEFTRTQPVATGYEGTRRYQAADEKVITNVVERVVMDGATLDLHATPNLLLDQDTGADSAGTHMSGLVVDFNMLSLGYVRPPNHKLLPELGGGKKAIVDAIFQLRCKNPLGLMAMKITAAS